MAELGEIKLVNRNKKLKEQIKALKAELKKLKPKEFNMANLEDAVEEMRNQCDREGTIKVKGKRVWGLERKILECKVNLSAN